MYYAKIVHLRSTYVNSYNIIAWCTLLTYFTYEGTWVLLTVEKQFFCNSIKQWCNTQEMIKHNESFTLLGRSFYFTKSNDNIKVKCHLVTFSHNYDIIKWYFPRWHHQVTFSEKMTSSIKWHVHVRWHHQVTFSEKMTSSVMS